MAFYILLLLLNFACFLPLYALHFRDAPNPVEFLTQPAPIGGKLKFFYAKLKLTDPFRINFDFTLIALLAAATAPAPWLTWFAAALLAFGFVEITYSAIMYSVFKRAPAIMADATLVKAGLNIAQQHSYWIIASTLALCLAIGLVSYVATDLLFRLVPDDRWVPLVLAPIVALLGLYNWRSYLYAEFIYRTIYSPTLHLYRSFVYSTELKGLLAKSVKHFIGINHFKDVAIEGAPNVIVICIESYGSIVFRDSRYADGITGLLGRYESELSAHGYRFASTHSEAPIFAGGSWLSYTSFTYGIQLHDLNVVDGLFARDNAFGSYESLFHVLKRNGYRNLLLCPLGGIDLRTIDWAAISRCFQSDHNIDFRSLGYRGGLVNYLGIVRRFAPPDQYSLNFAYESARESRLDPFSLFFCTLNSHFPWESPTAAVADWRTLNDPDVLRIQKDKVRDAADRYLGAIRYQLDFILRFIVEHAADDPLVVLFGDHQPPFLTPVRMGKQTPVHVIGRNNALVDVLTAHGFSPALNLAGTEPRPIEHAGFLSLFLKAVQTAYGTRPDLQVEYREHGVSLLDAP